MGLSTYIQFFFQGMTNGGIYSLVALGFGIIYSSTGLLNFAQGEFVMLGGILTYAYHSLLSLPLSLAVILAVFSVGIVAGAMERLTLYPMRHLSVHGRILITLGVTLTIEALVFVIAGTDIFYVPPFTSDEPIKFLGASVLPQTIWILAVGFVVMTGLATFFRFTLMGQAFLACAINRDAARMVGINAEWSSLIAFVIGGVLGGVGGALIAPVSAPSYDMGVGVALKGICAAVIGGIGNPIGAVVGGFILGLIESYSIAFISSGYKDGVALFILILILMLKPSGIFFTRET